MKYILCGYFLQEIDSLPDSIMDSVSKSLSSNKHGTINFYGALYPESSTGIIFDEMVVEYGIAKLTKVLLDENKLSFVKTYARVAEPITYLFEKADGRDYWIGRYETSDLADYTRCFIIEAPDGFETDSW